MSILHNLQYLEDTHNHSRFFLLFIDYIISFLKRSYPDNIDQSFLGRCGNGKNNQNISLCKI